MNIGDLVLTRVSGEKVVGVIIKIEDNNLEETKFLTDKFYHIAWATNQINAFSRNTAETLRDYFLENC